jgi:membrane-associated phospholipid phosphatase
MCAGLLQAQEASRSAPEPAPSAEPSNPAKPAKPTIKTREIGGEPIGPISRLPKYIYKDQKGIWTSPFRMSKSDAKWWLLFGGATAALIATDRRTVEQIPNSKDALLAGKWGSRLGAAYTLLPVNAGVYFLGSATHNERLRETGILAFEALADSTIVELALKGITMRERPLEGNGKGRFWEGQGRLWNSKASFPSGHAINSWALASIVAHEYPHPRIIPILAYGLSGTVVLSRLAAHKHFPSDVVAGSAMGWFIGDFIYRRRHNRNLDARTSLLEKVADHVTVGFSLR